MSFVGFLNGNKSFSEKDFKPSPKTHFNILYEHHINILTMSFVLPELFVFDKNGKERFWKIRSEGDTVFRQSGCVGGKPINFERTFEGVNIGKTNETTAKEQAKREAEKMWVKQLSSGYKPKCKEGLKMAAKVEEITTKNGGKNTGASSVIRGRETSNIKDTKNLVSNQTSSTIIPMSASPLKLQKPGVVAKIALKYFDFDEGVYMQWKLDGWRCVARIIDGKVVLTTRNGKQYPWFSSLRSELCNFLNGKEHLDGLDGELYTHRLVGATGKELDHDEKFSIISSMCGLARSKPHELEEQIEFHAFDLVDLSSKVPFKKRYELLNKLFHSKHKRIVLCDTQLSKSQDDIFTYHDSAAQQGYEGCMIRASSGMYTPTRSQYLCKYKHFLDEEFEVCGVERDKGVGKENFSFVLKTRDNKIFKAKPVGSVESRLKMFANADSYKGKMMTVKFQEYSGEGIPRFPISRGLVREDK